MMSWPARLEGVYAAGQRIVPQLSVQPKRVTLVHRSRRDSVLYIKALIGVCRGCFATGRAMRQSSCWHNRTGIDNSSDDLSGDIGPGIGESGIASFHLRPEPHCSARRF